MASNVVREVASGYHLLRIKDYSRTKGIPTGGYTESCPFVVGGHRWSIRYYPNGKSLEYADFISLLLVHDDEAKDDVDRRVQADHRFQFADDVENDDDQVPLPCPSTYIENYADRRCCEFVEREVLEKSRYMKNDSFTVRCDVVVVNDSHFRTKEDDDDGAAAPQSRVVANKPPLPDLQHHLGELLIRAGKDADMAFEVGGRERFAAHRCVLAARSKVFKAELFGAMKESVDAACVVRVNDMEPQVFKALLFFVYTDSLPEMKREEEEAICQHLLVAADVYDMQRLKLICENKLCKYIDVGTVASILALADQYHCHGLMKACFDFVSSPDNLMAVFATDGFNHLSRSCPFITEHCVIYVGSELNLTLCNTPAAFRTHQGLPAMASRSASIVHANVTSGYQLLTIDGYMATTPIPTGECMTSSAFAIGGHQWRIRYYPNGKNSGCADYISFDLVLDEKVAAPVYAQHRFRFAGDAEKEAEQAPAPPPCFASPSSLTSFTSGSGEGPSRFVKRRILERSRRRHLKNDSFTVRCDVVVTEFRPADVAPGSIDVDGPPSDLHRHLGDLLRGETGADVVFEVGGERFAAHRCVLDARSSVFDLELFGATTKDVVSESTGIVRVDGMEARVFKALLFFAYTDSLPEMTKKKKMEEQADGDDRYDVDAFTVGKVIALAEQHDCRGLRKACLDFFIRRPGFAKEVLLGTGDGGLISCSFSFRQELFEGLIKER
uniref:BTB domain-containing protein n=1 Tax=Oryza punctata TaxID=4537 RepID=A0A0E0L4S1_ORYPU